jgi:hypothetical protein
MSEMPDRPTRNPWRAIFCADLYDVCGHWEVFAILQDTLRDVGFRYDIEGDQWCPPNTFVDPSMS